MITRKYTHMQTTETRLAPAEALRNDFLAFADTLGLTADARDACLSFLMEKSRAAWINGKEFGWKKAWNWKRGQKGGAQASA